MFRLTKYEFAEVVTNCDHLQSLKFRPTLPYAFTEQGVAMLYRFKTDFLFWFRRLFN